MLKSLIIEDEINNLEALEMDLSRYCPEVAVVESCMTAKEGLWAIEKHQPNLVFLDIEMPRMDAFQMLEQLGAINFDIIFTTAHSGYAIKAFELSAIDYLLKPINPVQLKKAVQKVIEQKEPTFSTEKILALKHNLKENLSSRMAVPSVGKFQFVLIDDIIYCEADGNLTKLNMEGKKTIFAGKNLKKIEDHLAKHPFFRIHHKYLIHLNHILEYHIGDRYVVMKDGSQLTVSQGRAQAFVQKIKEMSI